MSTRSITRTTHYIEHDGQEFEVPHEPLDGTEIIHIEGDRAVVGYLSQDEWPPDPRENDNLGTMVCWHHSYNLGDKNGYRDSESFLRDLAGDWADAVAKVVASASGSEIDPEELPMEVVWALVNEHYTILPLSLYDHSGITMRVGSGPHPLDPGGWDSGQVGWVYVSNERFFAEGPSPIGALHAIDENRVGFPSSGKHRLHGKGTKKMLVELEDAFAKKKMTALVRRAAECYLESEVKEYDRYLTGECYGIVYVEYARTNPNTLEISDNVLPGFPPVAKCHVCGNKYDASMEGTVCPNPDCESREEDTWEQVGDDDSCWGFLGYEYAKGELESGMKYWVEQIQEKREVAA